MRDARHGTRRRVAILTGLAAVLPLALAACTSGSGTATGGTRTVTSTVTDPPSSSSSTSSSAPSTSSTPPSTPESTSSAPAGPLAVTNSAQGKIISPAKPVRIGVVNGTLTKVTMVNPEGRKVTGAIAAGGTSWSNTEVLGYDKTYQVTAVAKNAAGRSVVKHTHVTTVTPSNQTLPYIDDLYGAPIQKNGKYGVAMVVNVVFDEHITDRAAAEKALQVTTSPHVDGSWNWLDDEHVHWRPATYYAPGTKVSVAANVYGKDLGNGLYGQSDVSTSFTIGRKQVTIATDSAPAAVNKVRVYNAKGRVIRTMNTSMGTHGGTWVDGTYINFFTLGGTYTVLGFENPARMCSSSYGLPPNAPGGYNCEDIPYGTKISTDGIYLHELDTTTYAQNHGQDVSHGCLNLDQANAQWFFQHSMIGDPVTVIPAQGAPKIALWQGGDWSVSWKSWLKGSALA